MGDSDAETLSNVTQGEFDFDDDSFEAISEDAKDFIDIISLAGYQVYLPLWVIQTQRHCPM